MSRTWLCFALIILCCALPHAQAANFRYERGGTIEFETGALRLAFDSRLHQSISYVKEKKTLTPTTGFSPGEKAPPPNFIVVDKQPVVDFVVDYADFSQQTELNTGLGQGTRLKLWGVASTEDGLKVKKTLTLDSLPQFPNAVVVSASYTNLDETRPLKISQFFDAYYLLDASKVTEGAKPYEFASFQPFGNRFGFDYETVELKPEFGAENYAGKTGQEESGWAGGGIPLLDVWTRDMGFCVASLEPQWQPLHFPIQVIKDGRVALGIVRAEEITLKAGETWTSTRCVVILHSLDYFDSLRTYAGLMAAQGIKMPTAPEPDYRATWCSWGHGPYIDRATFLKRIPELKQLGLGRVNIDDGWFKSVGDWDVEDKERYPKGEEEFKKMIDEFHNQGFKVTLWWSPGYVQVPSESTTKPGDIVPGAKVARDHLDWLVKTRDGKVFAMRVLSRMVAFACPTVAGAVEYHKELTRKFVKEWGIDGFKLDALYVPPPCFDPDHKHADPHESERNYYKLLDAVFETGRSLKPDFTAEICPCGEPPNFYLMPYMTQPVTADPTGSWQLRKRTKMYKALMGANAAVLSDHIELSDNGDDFASVVGTGGVPITKFTMISDAQAPQLPEKLDLSKITLADRIKYIQFTNRLDAPRLAHWKTWLGIYADKLLSKGEYLNLYDIVYDKPEAHVIKKDGKLYYAFYAEKWNGPLEFRGLAKGTEYDVVDYVENKPLGQISGNKPRMDVSFDRYLLVEVTPRTK